MAPRRLVRSLAVGALALLGVGLASGCGGDERQDRAVVGTTERVPDVVADMVARPSGVADAEPRLAALAPAGRDDRQLALVVSAGATDCRLWTYVTAPDSVRYGGMGVVGGGCGSPDTPLNLGVVVANRMTIVTGVVAATADDLSVTYADGTTEHVALTGPVLPETGGRAVLFETGNRTVRQFELRDAEGHAMARQGIAE